VNGAAEAQRAASGEAPPFSWLDAPVAFVDLETTGGNPAHHRVIEIGVVAATAGGLEYEWSSLVNPGMPIPYGVQCVTGITDDMVEHAPIFEDLAAQLAERFEGRLFVAHNARFDYGFLREEFRRSGIRFESRVACTVKLSRRVNPGLPRHNLDVLIAYLGLHITRRHRALPDAQALWQFWCDLRARSNREEIDKALERVTRVKQRKSTLRRVLDAPTVGGAVAAGDVLAAGRRLAAGRGLAVGDALAGSGAAAFGDAPAIGDAAINDAIDDAAVGASHGDSRPSLAPDAPAETYVVLDADDLSGLDAA
jgi:DNA polymerase III epsilon subunit family exonuclease